MGTGAYQDMDVLQGVIHKKVPFLQGQLESCWLSSSYIQKGVLLHCFFWHLSHWKPAVCRLTEYLPLEESIPLHVQKDDYAPSPGFGWQAKNQAV